MQGLLVTAIIFGGIVAAVAVLGLWIAVVAHIRVRELEDLYNEDQEMWERNLPSYLPGREGP